MQKRADDIDQKYIFDKFINLQFYKISESNKMGNKQSEQFQRKKFYQIKLVDIDYKVTL